jgi:dolichyl-phosphate-mannose-protein mannosyltransferase
LIKKLIEVLTLLKITFLFLIKGIKVLGFVLLTAIFLLACRTLVFAEAKNLAANSGIIVLLLIIALFILFFSVYAYFAKKNRNKNIPSGKRGAAAYFKLMSNNDVERTKPDRKDFLILVPMTLVYLIIALVNLGSLNVPQTSWKALKAGEEIVIDPGRQVNISRIYYYGGFGTGSYNIEYMDGAGQFKPFATIQKTDKDIYLWKYVSGPDVRTGRLKISVNTAGATLNEIGIFEKGSTAPVKSLKIIERSVDPADIGKVENLFDEQDSIDYGHTFLTGMIFDEIYHARTAYEYLHNMEPTEWTHPPLGKILISTGIFIFGMNPFGWRIVGTLFGVMMIPLMYMFGKKLFKKRFYAFCSAFLMMFDFMHFSLTRIATIDVYGTFFVILMYYFMYDYFVNKSYAAGFKKSLKPLFLSGLFFGLGAASKWIGLYAGGGLALLFFIAKYREYNDYRLLSDINYNKLTKPAWLNKFIPVYLKRTLLFCVLFFIIIPAIIYVLSYIPYMSVPGPGHGLDVIIRNQRDMLNYHSYGVLGATHTYSSHWWEWPIMRRPLETYTGSDLAPGMSSSMTIMGNPAIWWVGIAAVILAAFTALRKGDRRMLVIFIAMAFQYMPWIAVERITFIYHFFSMVPFVIISIVYMIKTFEEIYPEARYFVCFYLGVVLLLFVMFYPVLSGLEVPRWYVEHFLIWLKGRWVF